MKTKQTKQDNQPIAIHDAAAKMIQDFANDYFNFILNNATDDMESLSNLHFAFGLIASAVKERKEGHIMNLITMGIRADAAMQADRMKQDFHTKSSNMSHKQKRGFIKSQFGRVNKEIRDNSENPHFVMGYNMAKGK